MLNGGWLCDGGGDGGGGVDTCGCSGKKPPSSNVDRKFLGE